MAKWTKGRQPLNYYVCVGHFTPDQPMPEKTRLSAILILAMSVIHCTITSARIKLFKYKAKASDDQQQLTTLGSIEKDFQSNKILYLSAFVLISVSLMMVFSLSRYSPEDVNDYPNYIYFWILNSAPAAAVDVFGCLMFAIKYKMRKRSQKNFSNV